MGKKAAVRTVKAAIQIFGSDIDLHSYRIPQAKFPLTEKSHPATLSEEKHFPVAYCRDSLLSLGISLLVGRRVAYETQ